MMRNINLIGLKIKVINAKNKYLIGAKGKVVDESKNMIVIKDKKIKRLIKEQVEIYVPSKNIKIKGKDLVGRMENRIKNGRL